jgi:hypothetical protein
MKDKGRNKDPCMSFGCECKVCKQHLSFMRREGDVNAVKCYEDEKEF